MEHWHLVVIILVIILIQLFVFNYFFDRLEMLTREVLALRKGEREVNATMETPRNWDRPGEG